jgi:diamine N-acetyltransferase
MPIVSLREITAETVRAVCRLSDTLSDAQRRMVAPNAVSIAQAHFEKHAWFRAIYADDSPVGFVMLYEDPEKPEYYLWRFMIAAPFQGMGYGRESMRLIIDHVRSRPDARELTTSCVEEDGGPLPFYEGLGFVRTGEIDDGETVLRLIL